MIAYAAIDLRGGRVVQLVGGRPEDERVSLPDSVAVAKQWVDAGFAALHVVDLDAALGSGSNLDLIREILATVEVPVQVGGGVRGEGIAATLLEAGAARVIVGTRAIEDPGWLESLAFAYPEAVVVAADVRDARIVTRGWTQETGVDAVEFLAGLDRLPLGGVLVTDVGREGRMAGADGTLFRRLAAATHHPLLAAGGIAGIEDLRTLRDQGVRGAVLGMSLYTGAIDTRAIAREFIE